MSRRDLDRDAQIAALLSDPRNTLADVGAHFGVSRERIRQIAERVGVSHRGMQGRRRGDPLRIAAAARASGVTTAAEVARRMGTDPSTVGKTLRALGIEPAVTRLWQMRVRLYARTRLAARVRQLADTLGRAPTNREMAAAGLHASRFVDHFNGMADVWAAAGIEAPVRGRGRWHGPKTHCKRGHPMSGDNLGVCNGARYCRECSRLRARVAYRDARRRA